MRTLQKKSEESSNTYIQPSMEIGKEDDEHEKEANHVADKVMRMSAGEEAEKMSVAKEGIQKMPVGNDTPIWRMTASPSPEMGMKASPNVEQNINSSKGSGQSLSPELQSEMGNKMGADFSGVKIHTGENAVQMNKEVGAKAFTHGNDIYFNSDQYNPSLQKGKHLLAHELTHVVQQGKHSSPIQRLPADQGDLDFMAKRIHKALRKLGKDQRTVFIDLQKLDRNQVEIDKLKVTYKNTYKVELADDIKKKLNGSQKQLALEMLNDFVPDIIKPQPSLMVNVPASAAEYTAKSRDLFDAVKNKNHNKIFGILASFQRNRASLDKLIVSYKADNPGNPDLKTDIQKKLNKKDESLALFLLFAPPSSVNVHQADVHIAGDINVYDDIEGGTVEVQTDVNYNKRPSGFSTEFKGDLANETRWIQFIWREVLVYNKNGDDKADPVYLKNNVPNPAGGYNLSSPENPDIQIDTGDADSPFYEAKGISNRDDDSGTIFDAPT
ncbi:MAG: eCIS core domain-containing protein, partial [Bacteroidia bacterium]